MSRLDEILTFVEIVDSGNISRAADKLGVAKSAVSRRLRDLEDRLKAQLVVRSTAGLSLTEIGKAFYVRAAQVLTDLDQAELSVTDASAELFGTIRLTAPISLTTLRLMPLLTEFAALHPDLTFDLHLSDQVEDIVSDGFDLAIRIGRLNDSTLVARRLMPMNRITCAAPAYLKRKGTPQHPNDLVEHDGLVSGNIQDSLYWSYVAADGSLLQAKPKTKVRANNGECIVEAAIAGLGIAALPEFVCSMAIERGLLVPILQEHPLLSSNVFAVYRQNKHLSHRVKVLIEFLIEKLGTNDFGQMKVLDYKASGS